jgi:hypothetical protein
MWQDNRPTCYCANHGTESQDETKQGVLHTFNPQKLSKLWVHDNHRDFATKKCAVNMLMWNFFRSLASMHISGLYLSMILSSKVVVVVYM